MSGNSESLVSRIVVGESSGIEGPLDSIDWSSDVRQLTNQCSPAEETCLVVLSQVAIHLILTGVIMEAELFVSLFVWVH